MFTESRANRIDLTSATEKEGRRGRDVERGSRIGSSRVELWLPLFWLPSLWLSFLLLLGRLLSFFSSVSSSARSSPSPMYKPHRVHLRGQGSQGKYDDLVEIREEITVENKEKQKWWWCRRNEEEVEEER